MNGQEQGRAKAYIEVKPRPWVFWARWEGQRVYYVRSDPDLNTGESKTYYDHWLDKDGNASISKDLGEFQFPVVINVGRQQRQGPGAKLRLLLHLSKRYEAPTPLQFALTLNFSPDLNDPWKNETPLYQNVHGQDGTAHQIQPWSLRYVHYPQLNGNFIASGEGAYIEFEIPEDAWRNTPVGQYSVKISIEIYRGREREFAEPVEVTLFPLYTVARQPAAINQLFETVVFTGSYIGMGITDSQVPTLEEQFVSYLQNYFSTRQVYQAAAQAPPLRYQTKPFIMRNGQREYVTSRNASQLLRYRTGDARAWVDFYPTVLAAQGVNVNQDFKVMRIRHKLTINGNIVIPDGSGILLGDWEWNQDNRIKEEDRDPAYRIYFDRELSLKAFPAHQGFPKSVALGNKDAVLDEHYVVQAGGIAGKYAEAIIDPSFGILVERERDLVTGQMRSARTSYENGPVLFDSQFRIWGYVKQSKIDNQEVRVARENDQNQEELKWEELP